MGYCHQRNSNELVIVAIRIKSGKWPRTWIDLAQLPANFTPNPERILDVSLNGSMDQVMELSSRIHEFCRKYSDDEKKIHRLALCIEEMAGNIARHGRKGNKPLSIDIRVIMEEDIIFRMRDNGVPFNPIQYDDHQSGSEDTIGIHLVRGITKEIKYTYANSMNNLMIKL